MKKEKKAENISMLEEEFTRASISILTDYRGLKTQEVNGLRRKLQESGGDYKVVKNTLAVKAMEKLNRTGVTSVFAGPIAIVFGRGEVQDTAKVFADYVRTSKISITTKGGFMGDTLLTTDDINTLATLPAKQVLIGQIIGGMKSPLYTLAGVLAAPISNLQGVLQARINQLEDNN